MQRGGRRQAFIILYTLAFGEAHWATSVRKRWANFRATHANTNNCSGELSLSALEVWVRFFDAPQPISLSPYPPPYDLSLSKIPVSLSTPTQSEWIKFKKCSCREKTQTHMLSDTHKQKHLKNQHRASAGVSMSSCTWKLTCLKNYVGMTSLVQCFEMYARVLFMVCPLAGVGLAWGGGS